MSRGERRWELTGTSGRTHARRGLVVDADGHTMEPDDLWTARMDADRWGDWIPRKVVEDDVYETYYAGGVVRAAVGSCRTRWPRRWA